ncbi:hypothetical protein ACP4OV_027023 [Aristida adscensionis]
MATTVTPLEVSVEATLCTIRAQEAQWRAQPFTIFRVPAYVRERSRTAYEPRMVSIGPYYHGAAALRAVEDHKWRYLHDLLSRNAALSSSALVELVRSMEPRARACYSERPLLASDDFVRMLLLDGCFILELFIKWHVKETAGGGGGSELDWVRTLISTDLLLLENQIPFFILERLYDVVVYLAGVQGGVVPPLVDLLLRHMRPQEGPMTPPPPSSGTREIHHLLHLYYECSVPKRPPPPKASATASPQRVKLIPCACEMRAAGVKFMRRSSAKDMYDVRFDGSRGVMEMPTVAIDDMTRPILVNLIAFEQTQGRAAEPRMVTSYVSLMSMLVCTAQDVELLRRRRILDNLLADDKEEARFFSRLGEGSAVDYEQHVFAGVHDDVRRYCESWWHRNRAALRRNYFGSPWSAISFVVAGLLVAIAATQTYFTVFPRE